MLTRTCTLRQGWCRVPCNPQHVILNSTFQFICQHLNNSPATKFSPCRVSHSNQNGRAWQRHAKDNDLCLRRKLNAACTNKKMAVSFVVQGNRNEQGPSGVSMMSSCIRTKTNCGRHFAASAGPVLDHDVLVMAYTYLFTANASSTSISIFHPISSSFGFHKWLLSSRITSIRSPAFILPS